MGRVTESQGICDFTDIPIFVQMTGHIGIAMNLGMTDVQLLHLLAIVEQKTGKTAADTGRKVLWEIIAGRKK